MYGPRDQLLAAAALSLDEHRARNGRDLLHLDQHLANCLRFAKQPGEARQLLSAYKLLDALDDFVEDDRLRKDFDVASGFQPFVSPWIAHIGEPDDRDLVPHQLAHELQVVRIEQPAGHHDYRRPRSPQRRAEIIERRHHLRLELLFLSNLPRRTAGSTSVSVIRTDIQ